MPRLGMVISVKKCIGCYSCMIACKQEHFLPPGIFWNRVLVGETGQYPTVTKQIYPVLCNHCKEPSCVPVCPTGATFKGENGIIMMDYDKCVGCRYCLIACPYQQRTFYEDGKREYFPGQGLTVFERIGRQLSPLQPGTVVKCNFCVDRIEGALRQGLKPAVDSEANPICVNACPVKARYFGDLDDPMSEVSILIKKNKGFQLHPEFGTDPSVYYVS